MRGYTAGGAAARGGVGDVRMGCGFCVARLTCAWASVIPASGLARRAANRRPAPTSHYTRARMAATWGRALHA
jgi:hypothetical protein